MHVSNGILFNHESPRRGDTFVTKKIVKAAVAISRGDQTELRLGNLDARRDWGYAPEFCSAMHLMLQQPQPFDYVIATGEMHTVREFCQLAFLHVGLDFRKYVVQDTKYFRPTEVNELQGDAERAKHILGWEPKVKFKELVKIMMEAELNGE
jgi:GDPmannose 4,6-dehydratase